MGNSEKFQCSYSEKCTNSFCEHIYQHEHIYTCELSTCSYANGGGVVQCENDIKTQRKKKINNINKKYGQIHNS